MSFDWSKLGSLSVPLNIAAPSTATSGVLDNSVTSNEAHTGAFSVGSGGGATDTTAGPTQTGGSVPGANFGQPPSYVSSGAMPGVQVASMLGQPLIALAIGAALFFIARRAR